MASNCINFSAKEYSEGDKDEAEHTDWKRTYRMLLKGSPCLQEIYCFMSANEREEEGRGEEEREGGGRGREGGKEKGEERLRM